MDSVHRLWQVLTADILNLEISYADEADPGADIDWSLPDATADAIWTHHNQNNWPRLIRFRFQISDKAMPDELHGTVYEVITTVGQ